MTLYSSDEVNAAISFEIAYVSFDKITTDEVVNCSLRSGFHSI